MHIDLNCDIGEGFGIYEVGADEALMPLISSANIACAFHAGDPVTFDRTIALAVRHDVAVGDPELARAIVRGVAPTKPAPTTVVFFFMALLPVMTGHLAYMFSMIAVANSDVLSLVAPSISRWKS